MDEDRDDDAMDGDAAGPAGPAHARNCPLCNAERASLYVGPRPALTARAVGAACTVADSDEVDAMLTDNDDEDDAMDADNAPAHARNGTRRIEAAARAPPRPRTLDRV